MPAMYGALMSTNMMAVFRFSPLYRYYLTNNTCFTGLIDGDNVFWKRVFVWLLSHNQALESRSRTADSMMPELVHIDDPCCKEACQRSIVTPIAWSKHLWWTHCLHIVMKTLCKWFDSFSPCETRQWGHDGNTRET